MRITGDKELERALRALGKGLPNSAIDKSLISASRPMVDDAKMRARLHRQPKRPKGGHIDENLKMLRRKESSRSKRRFVFGATGKRKSVLSWLEMGTAPHWQPRRFGGIMHPGARPFPVMRPAFDAHADKTVIRFGHEIWQEVERLVYRLNRGGRRK